VENRSAESYWPDAEPTSARTVRDKKYRPGLWFYEATFCMIPEIRILRNQSPRNFLIFINPENGTAIALTRAASDAQALHRKSHAEQVPAAESSNPRDAAPAGASKSPKAKEAKGDLQGGQ
jgi:hypothetical protein